MQNTLKKINPYEVALYENYNALFFNSSDKNEELKSLELFEKYLKNTDFRGFIKLMEQYDVTDGNLYHLWVMTWKQNYKHLTKAIRLTKKYRKSTYLASIGCNSPWKANEMARTRWLLGIWASRMMELRMAAKEKRKEFRTSV